MSAVGLKALMTVCTPAAVYIAEALFAAARWLDPPRLAALAPKDPDYFAAAMQFAGAQESVAFMDALRARRHGPGRAP